MPAWQSGTGTKGVAHLTVGNARPCQSVYFPLPHAPSASEYCVVSQLHEALQLRAATPWLGQGGSRSTQQDLHPSQPLPKAAAVNLH